jgi:hypothetical protein
MEYLIPISFVRDAIYDYRQGPKIILGVIVSASGTIYYVYGFGTVEIIVYSLLTYECFIRVLYLLIMAFYIFIWAIRKD